MLDRLSTNQLSKVGRFYKFIVTILAQWTEIRKMKIMNEVKNRKDPATPDLINRRQSRLELNPSGLIALGHTF